ISISRHANAPAMEPLRCLAMSDALPGFGEGDLPRDNPVFRLQARRRGGSAPNARIIRPDPEALTILVRGPPVVVAPQRRMALELAEECGPILDGRLRAAATRAQLDKLAIDRLDLSARVD